MDALRDLWTFIWQWYNLPYTLSLLGTLFLGSLQFLGLADDVGLGADADLEVDGDLDAELDGDADGEALFGPVAGLFDLLGVGRVPLTLLLLLLTSTFGFLGWTANQLWLGAGLPALWPFFVTGWVLVFALALLVTARLGLVVGGLVPPLTTSAATKEQLVGLPARVLSPTVTERYGQVRVRDGAGTLHTVFAVTPRSVPPIERDVDVVLVEFDPQKKLYTVVPLDLPP